MGAFKKAMYALLQLIIVAIAMEMFSTVFDISQEGQSLIERKQPQQDVELFNMSTSRGDDATEQPLTMPSYLQLEVDRIIHTPHEAKITVTFKDSNDRKCLKPRIMGRLSGPYLTIIRWNDENMKMTEPPGANNRTRQDTITGYYKVPSPGRYFIEIIGLLCNDFLFHERFHTVCLEDPLHHHLTAPNSFIDVTVTTATASKLNFPSTNAIHKNPLGHWKWSNDSAVPVPMKTRYQGQACRQSTEPRCIKSGSLDRFTPYQFEWSNGVMNLPTKFEQSGDTNEIQNLCLVGFSHSRILRDQFQRMRILPSRIKQTLTWIKVHYPVELTLEIGNEILNSNCSIAIVGVGQWAASKKTTFPDYHKQMDAGLKIFKHLGIHVVLRKIHYNPLGDEITKCPPRDGRSPAVIDGYNEILQSISRKLQIPFIDTGDIMDPMWDAAPDWCHYTGLEAEMEAFYIDQEIIRMADETKNKTDTTVVDRS